MLSKQVNTFFSFQQFKIVSKNKLNGELTVFVYEYGIHQEGQVRIFSWKKKMAPSKIKR